MARTLCLGQIQTRRRGVGEGPGIRDWLMKPPRVQKPSKPIDTSGRQAGSVYPEGRGQVNRRGLDFYDRLVDGLLARGISPVATLYHWDLPQVLQDQGGWENRDSSEWFADYATALFTALADRVDLWLTINEAKVIAEQGYHYARMAPGKSDASLGNSDPPPQPCSRRGRGVRGVRGIGRIGPCLQLAPCYPADGSPEANAAARAADIKENTLYLDPLLKSRYPDLSRTDRRVAAGIEAATKDGDLAAIAAPVDFLGVNYYSPVVVDGQERPVQPHPISAAGWQQVYPQGLYDILMRLRRDYASPQVLINENGVPDDPTDSGQPTADHARVRAVSGLGDGRGWLASVDRLAEI